MSTQSEFTRRYWTKMTLYILGTIAIIGISGVFIALSAWPIGFIVWLLLIVCSILFVIVRWHARVTAYRCSECRNEFEITAFKDFISPHVPDKKYLMCPKCGKRSWAMILAKRL